MISLGSFRVLGVHLVRALAFALRHRFSFSFAFWVQLRSLLVVLCQVWARPLGVSLFSARPTRWSRLAFAFAFAAVVVVLARCLSFRVVLSFSLGERFPFS